MIALKQDLRQAHFNMGNNQTNYLSSAKESLVSHEISDQMFKEAQELGKKMQHANFSIGDEKNRQLKDA
jgi:hypothetical protein